LIANECSSGRCSAAGGSRFGRGIFEPDLSAEGDGGVDLRVCVEKNVEGAHDAADSSSVESEASWNADKSIGPRPFARSLSEQWPEVTEVTCHDRALLGSKRRSVCSVRSAAKRRLFADRDDVVASVT